MQFEVIKKNHKKEIIIGAVVLVIIAIVLIVNKSFAKYQTTKNVPIASGTINYKVPDFKTMAMYQQKANQTCTTDSCYSETTTMPSAQSYVINENKSYCTINSTKETGITLKTINGNHIFKGLNKNSKCYLYFDNVKTFQDIIKTKELLIRDDFSKVITENTTGKMYMALDNDGISYYYAGAPTDNYVKFAGFYWRIIRINGDGTIRMIYEGTEARANGKASEKTHIGTIAFNTSDNNNMYVGFKYTSGELHGTGTESEILKTLNSWYDNNLKSYESNIDTNAGFCNDREPSTNREIINGLGGTGTTETYYVGYLRINSKGLGGTAMPTYKCKNENDLFTKVGANKGNKSLTNPIGLITADEAVYAGGLGEDNRNYYLFTGYTYWTMTPYAFSSDAYAFMTCLFTYGTLGINNSLNALYPVRPVINIRSDVTLTGTGTASNPYVVH